MWNWIRRRKREAENKKLKVQYSPSWNEVPMGEERRVPEQTCPACRCRINSGRTVFGSTQRIPRENDLGLCYQCGAILMHDANLRLQIMSNEKWEKLPEHVKNETLRLQKIMTVSGMASHRSQPKKESDMWGESND